VDSDRIVTASFISACGAKRQMAHERVDEGGFIEAFIDVPLEVCIQRDCYRS